MENKSKQIRTEETLYQGEKRIKLVFDYDKDLIEKVKKIPGRMWSESMKCWHIPVSEKSRTQLNQLLRENNKHGGQEKNAVITSETGRKEETYYSYNNGNIRQFERWLRSQRYSLKTIDTYIHAIHVFLRFCDGKKTEVINNSDIIRFNNDYILKNGYSVSFQNQVITAIKLFFSRVENKIIITEEIERPRRSKRLPEILAQTEIEILLNSIRNIKHRSMISLIYACGLRRSELINLQILSVDSKRRLLKIKESKGRKDRVVPLPEAMIDILRVYYTTYKPKIWLFEGNQAGEKYSESSLQQVFRKAILESGIKKGVTLHSLRHSYATHLLEHGTDLRFIQEMLGHKSSKTTEIYTHVTSKSIERITSPFEYLSLKKNM